MNGMNKCEIIGNVVKDAVLKTVLVNGVQTPCCSFSVAVNETRSNGDPITTYFDVTAWREYATKIAPWVLKGRQVFACGNVRLNQYTSNGAVRTSLQLHNPTVILMGKKPAAKVEPEEEETYDDDELPFG